MKRLRDGHAGQRAKKRDEEESTHRKRVCQGLPRVANQPAARSARNGAAEELWRLRDRLGDGWRCEKRLELELGENLAFVRCVEEQKVGGHLLPIMVLQ